MVGEGHNEIVNNACFGRFGFISEDILEDQGHPSLLDRNQLVEQFKTHHSKYLKAVTQLESHKE